MITLRLFRTADPFHEIDSREMVDGEIIVGRDLSADWTIDDPRSELSRRHCVISRTGERLQVRDVSSNGLFAGAERRRLPRERAIDVAAGETLYLGEYMILLDSEPSAEPAPQPARAELPAATASRKPGAITDAAMLEAFCGGAALEASSFAGEDPMAVMHRLGVVYRQVINDLCGLMSERAMLKDSLQLERTTISARDNNPLKWAPPQRVAVDLLREGETGFLKGAAAFKASFSDLRRHGECLQAASRAAVRSVVAELDPATIEAGVKKQPLAFARHESVWKQFQERHATLRTEVETSATGRIESAFRGGYAAHLLVLEEKERAA